ncbi:MAG: hydroxyacylglutathione hydrolase [Desulfopila sp.]|nr:hydroxyacylglutathione hydrolase [Desulfopila sp.]
MNIQVVPCSFDNYSYLLQCPESGDAAVVDPTEAYPLLEKMDKLKARLTTILCTHHHHDHIDGIQQLLQECKDARVVCHASDRYRIPLADFSIQDGDKIAVGNFQGTVIHTPGHTSGSVCYLFDDHLFAGDTLFGAGCGRLFEGDASQMFMSLSTGLAVLPDTTRIYFGHEYTRKNLAFAETVEPDNRDIAARKAALGDDGSHSSPSTIMLEKKTNPFLRCESAEIRMNLERQGYTHHDDPVKVFTILRSIRDTF